jgi:uncharacterized membrane protein YjjP (DUF1212 family)
MCFCLLVCGSTGNVLVAGTSLVHVILFDQFISVHLVSCRLNAVVAAAMNSSLQSRKV